MVCKAISPKTDLDRSLTIFAKEIHFYSDIVPAIEKFEEIENVPQIERINAFAQCFGSRLSLNPSKVISSMKRWKFLLSLFDENKLNSRRTTSGCQCDITSWKFKCFKLYCSWSKESTQQRRSYGYIARKHHF